MTTTHDEHAGMGGAYEIDPETGARVLVARTGPKKCAHDCDGDQPKQPTTTPQE